MDCLLSERSPSPQEASPTHQETCPKCSNRLGPPLKSSGRQICIKCGWTDKPKGSLASPQDELPSRAASASVSLPDYELKKLLDQAASESLNNMKPKRKQPQNSNKNKFLPLEEEGD